MRDFLPEPAISAPRQLSRQNNTTIRPTLRAMQQTLDDRGNSIDAARVRAFAQRLARTERYSKAELHAYQAPLIAKLLTHARSKTEFYRDRLDFDLSSFDAIDAAWHHIPILTRAEAVENKGRLESRSMPPEVGNVVEGQTSGSSGTPLRFKRAAQLHTASIALTERMFKWWRIDGKKTFAQVSYYATNAPRVLTQRGWHSARPNGLRYLLSHTFEMSALLDWLTVNKPTYFGAYSSIVKELAIESHRRSTQLKFDLVFSYATVVDPDVRALCRSAFDCDIADTYGSQEIGHIAAQCPDCGEYHVSAETCLVEVLRDDGSSAASGEIGRVIVTPFYSYPMPFIRYELGDLAEVGSSSPACSRRLPTIRRILGRYRNLFRFRDGRVIWPTPGQFRHMLRLKQFQIVQTDFDNVEIRYVPENEQDSI